MNEDEGETRHIDATSEQQGIAQRRVPESARCGACNRPEVAGLRYFSVGSGSVYRTLADDVYCRRCGYIGQPVYDLPDDAVSTQTN